VKVIGAPAATSAASGATLTASAGWMIVSACDAVRVVCCPSLSVAV
jgi:hypothetical protein